MLGQNKETKIKDLKRMDENQTNGIAHSGIPYKFNLKPIMCIQSIRGLKRRNCYTYVHYIYI